MLGVLDLDGRIPDFQDLERTEKLLLKFCDGKFIEDVPVKRSGQEVEWIDAALYQGLVQFK